jgi:phosphotransferase system enzyme I (PtsI)
MLEGVNASDGIGIGIAQVAVEPDLSFVPTAPDDPKAEEKRYENARDAFVAKTEDQIAGMRAGGLEEEAEIMQAHIDFADR